MPAQLPHRPSSSAPPPLRHPALANAAFYFEKYVLSLIYLGLAAHIVWLDYNHQLGFLSSDGADHPSLLMAVADVLFIFVQFFIAVMLLVGRRPAQSPDSFQEYFVPLATAFFFLAYYTIPWFPADWQRNLYPTVWPESFQFRTLHPLDAAGFVLAAIGPVISLWGVVSLRLSFGIFVSVRQVVLRGPYRFVRHPIYLGYVCIYASLVLLERTAAIMLIAALHLALFVWRAKLEEHRLAAHSAEYRANMARTGFLFPRLWPKR